LKRRAGGLLSASNRPGFRRRGHFCTGYNVVVLEALFLIYLCRRLGAVLRSKGRPAGWWQVLLVAGWLGGEVFGGIVAFLLFRVGGGPAYTIALLSASGVAMLLFALASALPLAAPNRAAGFSVVRPARTPDPSEL
jgi:hypothetical protein